MEFFMARVLWTKSYINCHCVRWGAKKKPKSFPLQKFGVCACQLLGAGLSSLGVLGVLSAMAPTDLGRSVKKGGGADYAHQMILAPPDCHTFRRPCGAQAVVLCQMNLKGISTMLQYHIKYNSKVQS